MAQQEQERKIEEAANKKVPTSDESFFHYSDQDIWKEGFNQGAEFALNNLSEPSENGVEGVEGTIGPICTEGILLSKEARARIMELLWVFSCDGTTDPKEITEEIIRAAQNCKPKQSNICPDCGYPKTTQGNGIIERICTCGESSEPIGRTDEELVKKIIRILKTKEVVDFSGGTFLDDSDFGFVAKEIAKLLPSSRRQENDVNDSFRSNRFIQAMIDNGFKLSSEDQIKISQLYISVL